MDFSELKEFKDKFGTAKTKVPKFVVQEYSLTLFVGCDKKINLLDVQQVKDEVEFLKPYSHLDEALLYCFLRLNEILIIRDEHHRAVDLAPAIRNYRMEWDKKNKLLVMKKPSIARPWTNFYDIPFLLFKHPELCDELAPKHIRKYSSGTDLDQTKLLPRLKEEKWIFMSNYLNPRDGLKNLTDHDWFLCNAIIYSQMKYLLTLAEEMKRQDKTRYQWSATHRCLLLLLDYVSLLKAAYFSGNLAQSHLFDSDDEETDNSSKMKSNKNSSEEKKMTKGASSDEEEESEEKKKPINKFKNDAEDSAQTDNDEEECVKKDTPSKKKKKKKKNQNKGKRKGLSIGSDDNEDDELPFQSAQEKKIKAKKRDEEEEQPLGGLRFRPNYSQWQKRLKKVCGLYAEVSKSLLLLTKTPFAPLTWTLVRPE